MSEVRDHNSQASGAGRLVGAKAQAVKNILGQVPKDVQRLLSDFTREVGYEAAPWADDCLGSKRWLPGHMLPG